MARHYRTIIFPARVGKPKDKAADENMVGIVSRRIIAALRNRPFFSRYEVNQAIGEELVKLIHRLFQKIAGNRKTAFERIDKPYPQPLPLIKYEYANWKETRVAFNDHVEYDGFFYSVHYSYVNRRCSVRATNKTIEIFIGSERVATHPRNEHPWKRYTTLAEHMPAEHQAVSGWSPDRFLSWADTIGPNTGELIKKVLESRDFPFQSYRACMGIMRLGQSYPAHIIEAGSRIVLDKNTCSFKYLSIILKQCVPSIPKKQNDTIILHENLRGSRAYAGGGIHA